MVRKPIGGREGALPASREAYNVDDEGDDNIEEGMEDAGGPSAFPISFSSTAATQPWSAGQRGRESLLSQRIEGDRPEEAFPGLAELKAQIEMDDLDRFERTGQFGFGSLGADSDGRMDRLGMLDEMLGAEPGEEEYARLEEWLDDDDGGEGRDDYGQHGGEGQGENGFTPLGDDEQEGGGEEEAGTVDSGRGSSAQRDTVKDKEAPSGAAIPYDDETQGDKTFDDDFDDFAAFQSAPSRSAKHKDLDVNATIDPAPLLYHLQSVRAELAGLDEEERRERAGKEVARVMRDLGFDAGDLGDLLGDDDE